MNWKFSRNIIRYLGRFRIQKNASSYRNNRLLQTAIEEERNKISEEFILEAFISFRTRVDTIIEKKW